MPSSPPSPSWQPTASEKDHPSIPLPLAFKIYCLKSRLTHSEFYIAHSKNQNLHAISGGYKDWFKATIALHSGPTTSSPVLGTALIKRKSIEITLPSSATLPSSGITHTMHAASSCTSSEFAFEFPIAGTLERFEWRRSRGEEEASLEGRGKGGWVLFRGEEVVAAYSVDLLSLKLSGQFAFFGSGRTGELGREFAVVAVIGALSLGQKKRDDGVLVAAFT